MYQSIQSSELLRSKHSRYYLHLGLVPASLHGLCRDPVDSSSRVLVHDHVRDRAHLLSLSTQWKQLLRSAELVDCSRGYYHWQARSFRALSVIGSGEMSDCKEDGVVDIDLERGWLQQLHAVAFVDKDSCLLQGLEPPGPRKFSGVQGTGPRCRIQHCWRLRTVEVRTRPRRRTMAKRRSPAQKANTIRALKMAHDARHLQRISLARRLSEVSGPCPALNDKSDALAPSPGTDISPELDKTASAIAALRGELEKAYAELADAEAAAVQYRRHLDAAVARAKDAKVHTAAVKRKLKALKAT